MGFTGVGEETGQVSNNRPRHGGELALRGYSEEALGERCGP